MLDAVRRYHRCTGRNLFDDAVAAERSDGSRVVLATSIAPANCVHTPLL
jgi:hypothetical protein